MLRAETPRIPPHYEKAPLAMFIAFRWGNRAQQDNKQLNVTQLIGLLHLQPDGGALARRTEDFHQQYKRSI